MRQYSIVQGIGWADNAILRKNGFTVIELDSYLNLFKMVASGRADLFCRGVNELPEEYAENKAMGNLTYDESFLLRYKMPYFLFINKQNTLAKQRLEEGLKIAYEDGSIMQFWRKKYEQSIRFSNLKKRRIFNLENNTTEATSSEYDKYIINPLTLE